MAGDINQPDIDDSRWEVDEQRHFVGMDCSVIVDGDRRSGVIQAIWCFRGGALSSRCRTQRRLASKYEQGTCQLRQFVNSPQMLIRQAIEAWKQAQAQLRAKLRKNPHRSGSLQPRVLPGPVSVLNGFFFGRLKRLAYSSGHALCRGVLGRRVGRDTTSMREQSNQQHEPSRIELQRNSRGTTEETDEEERGQKSVPHSGEKAKTARNPQTGGRCRHSELAAVRRSAFITTTNWYHSVTIPSPFPTGSGEGGTSVVPLLSSGGVPA